MNSRKVRLVRMEFYLQLNLSCTYFGAWRRLSRWGYS